MMAVFKRVGIMKFGYLLISLITGAVASVALCQGSVNADQQSESPTYTYVLVHGASGGGWDWKPMDQLLSAEGHTVYRATLSGLGERAHLASPDINLTTHINDVANLILFEELEQVVLVGHSYGGMVITGLMDRMPENIKQVFFLDAFVPADGMAAVDLWGDLSAHKIVDGMVHFSWLDKRRPVPGDVPQSYKTLTESVSFSNPLALELPVTYVPFVGGVAEGKVRAGLDPSWKRAVTRGWTVKVLESDHNAQRSHPRELAELLLGFE
jgi:pimeloyl-ACP methyl ester carboxylesterase